MHTPLPHLPGASAARASRLRAFAWAAPPGIGGSSAEGRLRGGAVWAPQPGQGGAPASCCSPGPEGRGNLRMEPPTGHLLPCPV